MSHQYGTALSHLILAGTGIYCLSRIKGQDLNFPHATFGIITINSLLGIWRWGASGNPDHGHGVDKPYRFTTFLQTIFALPCITTPIWLGYHYTKELAYAHSAVSLIPLVGYLTGRPPFELVELILAVNSVSLGVVCFMEENYYGVAAAVSFAFNHFCISYDGDFMDIPAQDMYNYGLCFFAYFALRALGES